MVTGVSMKLRNAGAIPVEPGSSLGPAGDDTMLSPEAMKTIAHYTETCKENAQLRARVMELTRENQLLEQRLEEMGHDKDHERLQKEGFQRCAVTMHEMIEVIARAAQRAQEAGVGAMMDKQTPVGKPKPHPVEDEMQRLVGKLGTITPS
jgi:hypothetical protein